MPTNRTFILVATILTFVLIILELSECGKSGEKHRKRHSSHRDSRDSHRDSGSASKTKSRSSTAKKSSASDDEAKQEWERIKNVLRFKKGAKFLIGVDKYDTQEQIISPYEEKAMRTMMATLLPSLMGKLGRAVGKIDYKYQKGSAEYKAYKLVRSKEFRECMIGKGSTFTCKLLSTLPGNTPQEVIEHLASSKGLWQKPLLKLIYYTGKGLRLMKLKKRRKPVDPKDLDRAIINGALQELKQTQMAELSNLAAELEDQIWGFFDTCANYLSGVADTAMNALVSVFNDVELNSDELKDLDGLAFHD